MRRRALSRAARLSVRALGVLPREARRGRARLGGGGGRPDRDRPAAAHRQGRAAGDVHGREPDRDAPVRHARGDRPDLLDERHHGHAQLHPADRGRRGELGHRIGAQLRGVRHPRRPADRVDLQRRAVRGGRGAGRLRAHRPVPRPGRDRQHGTADAGAGAAAARRRRAHAVLRRPSGRVGGRARRRSARIDRGADPRGRRARRRRAVVPRAARGGLGRAGHRGDGHRRHRRVAVG